MTGAILRHSFDGTPFTIGIEEELMLIDADSLDLAQEIEALLADLPPELDGRVKPEFMQSFLEVATTPCRDVHSAGEELRALRRAVAKIAEGRGLLIGAAGTHPFALWEDQRIVERPRYQELLDELGYVARQFLIFGTHIHVGINGPNKAIYVADGIRRYLPLLLALSANSPFLRGHPTGMMSSRTPVFRALPRAGIPPHLGSWEIYSRRVETMMRSGVIDDYTYIWWDVRPHPNLGTVETRIFDQQTRIEHTMALAALTVSVAHLMAARFDAEEPMTEMPTELIDDNKVRAALRGVEGDLVNLAGDAKVPAARLAREVIAEVGEHAEELGCRGELEGIEDLIENGTGARRQLRMLEGTANLKELVVEMAEKSRP